MTAATSGDTRQRDLFPPPPPDPPAMVTLPAAELAKLKRLLKFSRSDRKRQAQCIADMKSDNARLYAKLNDCGWALDGWGKWKRLQHPTPAR